MSDIKISYRIKKLVECVKVCNTVADIGCDHGLLPYFLLENKICKRAILVDVSLKSLNKAKKLFSKSGLIEQADFRKGFGLSVLKDGEADFAVVAGMGGMEIINILNAGNKGVKHFLLQPMKNVRVLREFLIKNNFKIENDFIIFDNNQFYDIILTKRERLCIGGYGLRLPRRLSHVGLSTLRSASRQLLPVFAAPNLSRRLCKNNFFTEAELEFGKDNINGKTEDFIKFLNKRKIQAEKILNKVSGEKREELLRYLELIDKILN